MRKREVFQGNHAIAEAAIRAGCKFGVGYPLTPASEIVEYLAEELPRRGGIFLQPESEVAVTNMMYGAAGSGVRTMTGTSSVGYSLMVEGLGQAVASELPMVIVDLSRGGMPGIGGLGPSQSDYFQVVKGGIHGDGRVMVLAPHTVQEAVDLTMKAFYLADKYRNPVLVLAEQCLGQSTEAVEFDETPEPPLPPKDWIVSGAKGRAPRLVFSRGSGEREGGTGQGYEANETSLRRFQSKYMAMAQEDTMVETVDVEDAEVVLVAFGTSARIARTAVEQARQQGKKVGLIRPITLFPFPSATIAKVASTAKALASIELSMGQMVEDVRLAAGDKVPVYFYGRCGGIMPTTDEILQQIDRMLAGQPPEQPDLTDLWRADAKELRKAAVSVSAAQQEWLKKYEASAGELEGYEKVSLAPKFISRVPPVNFCAGCGYGIIVRLIAEVVDELGMAEDAIMVQGSGCTGLNQNNWRCDVIRCLHGRPAAVATAVKRCQPNKLVFTISGDGDACNIGLAETVSAAIRGEKFTMFMMNNSGFGETGGQMAFTTILGQKTPTCPRGKNENIEGYPIHMPEMLAVQEGTKYLARGTVNSPAAIRRTKGYIRRALQTQIAGLGFSMVEFLSMCPSGWRLKPLETLQWVDELQTKTHKPGEIKVTPVEAIPVPEP